MTDYDSQPSRWTFDYDNIAGVTGYSGSTYNTTKTCTVDTTSDYNLDGLADINGRVRVTWKYNGKNSSYKNFYVRIRNTHKTAKVWLDPAFGGDSSGRADLAPSHINSDSTNYSFRVYSTDDIPVLGGNQNPVLDFSGGTKDSGNWASGAATVSVGTWNASSKYWPVSIQIDDGGNYQTARQMVWAFTALSKDEAGHPISITLEATPYNCQTTK